ncbi:TonB-dependent receptor [Caulobacter sp. BE254]|nr:TonB-dependent receptor [Caulobacter sp. BE254]MDR7117630.1 TonB-dependent receptor [Caulobacter sp. BE254]
MSQVSKQRVRALKLGASSGAMLMAMALAGAAAAQQTPAPAADDTAVEEVVVTGFRASLANALDIKRRENDLVDVIKAQDIADFPDLNLAESLQRVPGVSIDRDGGEGRTITVRGLGPDFTVVRLNGLEALATTGGKDSSGGANRGRQFDFSIFASELFNSVTVRKSTSASNEEGSLGAIIDLQASRPFDFSGPALSMGAKIGWNDLSRKKDPRFTFLASNRWDTGIGEIGALISVAYAERKTLEEGSSTGRWENPSVAFNSSTSFPCFGAAYNPQTPGFTPGGPTAATSPACTTIGVNTPSTSAPTAAPAGTANNLWHPRIPRYGRLQYDQKRLGITGSLQWRPTENSTLSLDALVANFTNNRDETYLEVISFSRSGAGLPQTDVVNFQADDKGHLIKGTFDDVDARVEYRHDDLKTEFNQFTLTYDTKFGDAGHLNLVYGQSRSIQDNPVQTTFSFDRYNSDGYSYDYSQNDKLPVLNYGFDPTQASNFVYSPSNTLGDPSLLRMRPSKAVNTFKTFRADVDYQILDGFKLRYGFDWKKFGFNSSEKRLFSRQLAGQTAYTAEAGFALPAGVTIADVSRLITGFGRGLDLPAGVPTSWIAPDLDKLKTAIGYDCDCINANGDFRLSSINQLGAVREVTEEDTALYLQGDFDYDLFNMPVRGNIGVRYVKTQQDALGHYNVGSKNNVLVTLPSGVVLNETTPIDGVQTTSREYHNTLPALNVSIQPAENVFVRFAAAKVMTRPQLQNLSPGYTAISQGSQTLTRGNPDLNPMLANNLDLSFEWYPDKETLLSAGFFQKDIKSYIQQTAEVMPWSATGLPDSLLTSPNTSATPFTVTTQVNSPGGKLKGFELSAQRPFTFLPAPFDKFGAILNYTHVKSDIDYIIKAPTYNAAKVQTAPALLVTQPLVNLSPDAFNATLYYENGPFKARISGSYRDAYLIQVAPSATNNNDVRIKEKTFNLDSQVSYELGKFTVTLEAINLTDQEDSKVDDSTRMSSEEYVHYGRQFYLGVKYKF